MRVVMSTSKGFMVAAKRLSTFPGMVAPVDKLLSRVEKGVVSHVLKVWPVDTGYSASLWEAKCSLTNGRAVLELSNESGYAEFVRIKGTYDLVMEVKVQPILDRAIAELQLALIDLAATTFPFAGQGGTKAVVGGRLK